MDRHVPDRTGGPAEAGTSGQTEGSLGKDVATAQEKQSLVSLQLMNATLSPKVMPTKDGSLRREPSGGELKLILKKEKSEKTLQTHFSPIGGIIVDFSLISFYFLIFI